MACWKRCRLSLELSALEFTSPQSSPLFQSHFLSQQQRALCPKEQGTRRGTALVDKELLYCKRGDFWYSGCAPVPMAML